MRSKNLVRASALSIALALGLAGCGMGGHGGASATGGTSGGEKPDVDRTAAPTTERAGVAPSRLDAARIGVREEAPYGRFLVDAAGRPLYAFTADRQGQPSTCYDACARAWPPLLGAGRPQPIDPTLHEELLGTVERRGESPQVTYGGWPLYLYAADRPGEVNGQDVRGHGGEWYLVAPDGSLVHAAESQ